MAWRGLSQELMWRFICVMAVSSDPVRAGVEGIARDYLAILDAALPEELDLPTNGTARTNQQLLFHMLLGQRVTRMVIVVMDAFSHLPPARRVPGPPG